MFVSSWNQKNKDQPFLSLQFYNILNQQNKRQIQM